MIRYSCVVIMALACCATLVSSESGQTNEDASPVRINGRPTIKDSPPKSSTRYQTKMSQKVGRFAKLEFFDNLFPNYRTLHKVEGAKAADLINYRPEAGECITFLRNIKTSHPLLTIPQFVFYDACLGLLFDTQEITDPILRGHEEFKTLYEKGNLLNLNGEQRECIYTLIYTSMGIEACSQKTTKYFNEFAACTHNSGITLEHRAEDTYLAYVYQLVRNHMQNCMSVLVEKINDTIEKHYDLEYLSPSKLLATAVNSATSTGRKYRREEKDFKWPKYIIDLHQAVEGIDSNKMPNIRETHRLILGASKCLIDKNCIGADSYMRDQTLENLKKFANHTLLPELKDKRRELGLKIFGCGLAKKFHLNLFRCNEEDLRDEDVNGVDLYKKRIDKLCQKFRSSPGGQVNNYVDTLREMVRALLFPELYDIDAAEFVAYVFTYGQVSSGLYSGIVACNILSYTMAETVRSPDNGKEGYKVAFQPEPEVAGLWPVPNYN